MSGVVIYHKEVKSVCAAHIITGNIRRIDLAPLHGLLCNRGAATSLQFLCLGLLLRGNTHVYNGQ